MTFDPQKHLIQIKSGKSSSDYLEVKWRLVWYRQECPQGTIETEILHLDLDKDVEAEAFVWNAEKRRSEKVVKTAKGVAVFKATIHDGKGGSATGTKSENAANFPDFIEKAESGSIGRALAALGYGTQFAPELNEEQRIVDSPVERPMNGSSQGQQDQSSGQAPRTGNAQNNGINAPTSVATEQQISSIKKLCQHLEKPEPDDLSTMTFVNAKQLLQELTEAYRAQKQQSQQATSSQQQGRQLANAEQKDYVNRYCDALQYQKPNLNTLTSEEANSLIEKYKAEYNKRKAAQQQKQSA